MTPTNLDNSDELENFLRYLRSDRRREALSGDEIETFPFASSLIGLSAQSELSAFEIRFRILSIGIVVSS